MDLKTLENVDKNELISIIGQLDKGLTDMHDSNKNLISEVLYLRKENDKLEDMIEVACEKLAKSYKKYSEKPNEKLFKPENWKAKLIKKAV